MKRRITLATVTRAAILSAISEFDGMGRDPFLARYGYRPANRFHLRHGLRSYDSKAILGVAWGIANGCPAALASEFSGGAATAERVFAREGFKISYGTRGDTGQKVTPAKRRGGGK